MAKQSILRGYNLPQYGVDVDNDDIHTPSVSFRQAQNFHPNPTSTQSKSIVTRPGFQTFNTIALSGTILGGVTIPSFEAGSGEASLFIGFGD